MKLHGILEHHYFIAFISTLVVSLGLMITSFFLPPMGKIDPSVLNGVSKMLLWPAIALAAKSIENGCTYIMRKEDMTEDKKKEEKE